MENKELKKELKKEIELNIEKEKLQDAIKEINKQVLTFTEKRKEITQYIVNVRKKNIEEYRDDEDRVAEYFDHEVFVREEAFKHIDRRLRELTILSISPYFGKINFEDELGEAGIYIGRFGLTKEEEYEPIVVDWRSPVSALFYAGKLGEVTYRVPDGDLKAKVLSKRQFIIKKARLLGMFDSSIDVKDEILQMVLSKNAGDKLKDIIMTIQQEQDNIIRQPRSNVVVVDGVAGSGKTTIALHRVAYLLYNYRNVLQDKVLIFGPNSIFMDYISTVLPSLGEVGVQQSTFRDFAMDNLEIYNIMSFKDYMEKVLSGDEEFKQNILYKNSLSYIKKLDELIALMDYGYFNIQEVSLYDETIVPKEEIDEMFKTYFKSMPLFRRTKKIKRIIYSKIKDKRDALIRQIEKEHNKTIKSLSEDELKVQQNNLEFIRRNKIRETIKQVIEVKKNLIWLTNPDIINIYNEFNRDKELIYDDLAAIFYLKVKLEGARYKNEVKHIVIDEAQDYSLLQFMVIKEFTGCNSFTIVGDSNQRIVPSSGKLAMSTLESVFTDTDIDVFTLSRSYRSTKQIMEYANTYLKSNKTIPLVRNGEEVVKKQLNSIDKLVDKVVEDIVKLKEKDYESIAIVCKDLNETKTLGDLIKTKIHVKVIDREDMIYSSGEVVIPSYFAKGLEFDAVILIDSENEAETKENKLKYVMATRALHELRVYKTSSIK